MTQPSCTPGPWKAVLGIDEEPHRWAVVVDGPREWHIATIMNGAPGDTLATEASNARLFAAAPKLLAACKATAAALAIYRAKLQELGCEGWIDAAVDAEVATAIAAAEARP